MADALKAVRKRVLQKATNEIDGGHAHDFGLALGPVIPPAEAHRIVVQRDDTRIGDGNAMGITAEIVRSEERRVGKECRL